MPIAIPILEEDSVELIINPWVACAQQYCHLLRAVRMNVELVDVAGLAADLVIFRCENLRNPVHFDYADSILYFKVLGLKLVEVHGRPFRTSGRLDESAQVVGNWPFDVVAVGLAHKK